MTPVVKQLDFSTTKILEFVSPKSLTIEFDEHHLTGRPLELSKGDRQFNFLSSSIVVKGVQTHKELEIEPTATINLRNSTQSIYLKGKHFNISRISYKDDLEGESKPEKILEGSITSLSDAPNVTDFNEKFLRFMVPVNGKRPTDVLDMYLFQREFFLTVSKKRFSYIPLNVCDQEFHLYKYQIADLQYLVIDCLSVTDLEKFQRKCFCILLVNGFISGNLISDECFILSYHNNELIDPINILYHSMRTSIFTNMPTFVVNAYSVYYDVDFERDEEYKIKKEIQERLEDGMILFPHTVYAKLASLFYCHEKLLRSTNIFIQSHSTSLEVRLPSYYVALEAISGYISRELATERKSLSPIKNKDIANEIITSFIQQLQKTQLDRRLSKDDFDVEILTKNINKLNAPPNANKLNKSFSFFGYELSSEQKKILNDRNIFLHGSFINTVQNDELFREGLHVALRLHFMVSFLLLKIAGFSGKIINYVELWSHITGKKLDEDRLVKI